jgi:hypothetical protein
MSKKRSRCGWEGKYCISTIKAEQDLSEHLSMLSHGQSLLSCSCMFSYHDNVPFFIQAREKMGRCIRFWSRGAISRSWNSWRDAIAMWEERKRKMAVATTR